MRKTIYTNICILISIMIVLCSGIIVCINYNHFHNNSCENIKHQTHMTKMYIENISENEKYEMISLMYQDIEDIRITLISSDGTVIFDNTADIDLMENHMERPEIIDALKNGVGESERYSDTINENKYYYAVRLNDGNVLRLSRSTESIVSMFIHIIPYVILVVFVMIIVSFLSAGQITEHIMKPINELNIDNLGNREDMYEELQPFFSRIVNENAEKEKTEKIRREFSANVSHELKTPLTAISGYAQMINNGMAQSQEDIFTFTGKIEKEASRLILLINDIIKLSHLDEEDIQPHKMRLIDLNEIASEVMGSIDEYAKSKNVKLYYSGEKAIINGSRTLISELIYNLLDNAVKYNKEEGSVEVVVGNLLDRVEISVEDTGIGIPEEEKERIFERFYRVDKSHSKTVGGTGLGLSIVKHVAICHNAEIDVKSRVNEGTIITVRFQKEQD